ncbi:hypothetical protein J7L18_10025 [Candidatus Bathyarchaeota archaeon]|nr:hypothetical protein [Candidatus Bathyarchaeota archaeon]
MSEEKLVNFLKTGKDWSRLATTVPGIFVLKLPAYKGSPSRLAVELNPVDEAGKPKKRRGLVLRSMAELEEFRELLMNEKLTKLMDMLESVNPKVEAVRRRKGEEIIEL